MNTNGIGSSEHDGLACISWVIGFQFSICLIRGTEKQNVSIYEWSAKEKYLQGVDVTDHNLCLCSGGLEITFVSIISIT